MRVSSYLTRHLASLRMKKEKQRMRAQMFKYKLRATRLYVREIKGMQHLLLRHSISEPLHFDVPILDVPC